ncbi:unnamed protein product [Rhizophagus irregularis]|nr:unnamed protein product [Rhizophagus irregularis]CAB5362505.1 unnamed protein product [Rhizophagus irregularis]
MEGVEYTGPGLPHDATTETSDNASTVDMTEENQNSSMTRRSNPNRSARSTQSTVIFRFGEAIKDRYRTLLSELRSRDIDAIKATRGDDPNNLVNH